ncbi:MAG: hypothetical protein N3B13_09305 [Deltaproteobacteria bacterium]|nr:hypothetical protein [Deltaproteobacteria bacterium]
MKNLPKIIIAAGLIIIFSLLFFYLYFLKADLIRLKGTLKKILRKGDIVIFFPDWEKNDILSLNGLPVTVSQDRQYLNLYGFKRAFIVKNTKHYHNKNFPLLNEMLPNKRFTSGMYEVEEYQLPLWNLSEHSEHFRVYVLNGNEKNECRKDEDKKYRCGDMGWQYVGLATVDINGQQSECIWAHPIGGKKIIIETELNPAISGNFIIYRGLATTSGFDINKPEIFSDVYINENKVFTASISRQREWLKDKFNIKEEKGKSLRIEIFSPQEYKNHFCFNIEAF